MNKFTWQVAVDDD